MSTGTHPPTHPPGYTPTYLHTLVMLSMKVSTGSSPLESSTVKVGPKSQNTEEYTPLTWEDMNWGGSKDGGKKEGVREEGRKEGWRKERKGGRERENNLQLWEALEIWKTHPLQSKVPGSPQS